MHANKKHPCGFLRFFKRDGSEGSVFPLQADEEYTIGSDQHATIRLKAFKSTLKPIQCVIKVDANGYAKLINKDLCHAVKLNNKALYSSKYLLPEDTFFVLDKKIRYENEHINESNLMKLSSRNKVNTPLSVAAVKGRKSYTDMKRRQWGKTESDVGFKSLKGSRTPHPKRQLDSNSGFSEKEKEPPLLSVTPEMFYLKTPVSGIKRQSSRSAQPKRTTSSCLSNLDKNPVLFCTTSSSGSEETQTGICVSPFTTDLDNLNTPPNNISVVEVSPAPYPSTKKRKSQRFTDNSEFACAKTPKTSSNFRNSLHLLSNKKGRKSSLSNVLTSISEFDNIKTPNNTPNKKLWQPLKTSPESSATPSVMKRRSSTAKSMRNSTIKLNETYSEEDLSPVDEQEHTTRMPKIKINDTYLENISLVKEQEATMEKSGIRLNETYSEEDLRLDEKEEQRTYFDDLPSVTKQKQTPNARKSAPKLNETFTESEFSLKVHKPVARKSVRKPNKTFSDADFPSQRQIHTPAARKRKFRSYLESASKSTTPIVSRNLQPLITKRRSTATENLNSQFFTVSPHFPTDNVTLRRPLRNVTSAYHLSQENVILFDSDLEHSRKSARDTINPTSQENRSSEDMLQQKTKSVERSDSISKDTRSSITESFMKNKSFEVFHSSPMIKIERACSESTGNSLFMNSEQHSIIQLSPLTRENSNHWNVEGNRSFIAGGVNNDDKSEVENLNEDESSGESSLLKQLTLVLSDEEVSQGSGVNGKHTKKKQRKSQLFSSAGQENSSVGCNSTLESNNTGSTSILETTRSSSFYFKRRFSSFGNNTFSDLPNTLSKSKNSTPEILLQNTKNESPAMKRTSKTNRSPEDDLSNITGVRRLTKTPPNDVTQVKGLRTTKFIESPENNLSDVAGIRKLMATPREQKQPKNDLSDVRGVRRLMTSPKEKQSPLNDITDVKGIKRLMRTPKTNKSPKNDLSNVAGVRQLMQTPRVRKQPENDLSDVRGVRRLMSTPKEQRAPLNDITDVKGIKWLMKTPRAIKSPKNDLNDIRGVKKLMKTHRQHKGPKNDLSDFRGVRQLMSSPTVQLSPLNDLTDVKGIKGLFRTPKVAKSPMNDLSDVYGVSDLMRSPKRKESTHSSASCTTTYSSLENNDVLNTADANSTLSDFDVLLNKKPVRTYRGKSNSPPKSKRNSPRMSDYSNIQPDVAKWVEEQDNYLKQLKETTEAGNNSRKRGTRTEAQDADQTKSETETPNQTPQFRTTRRRWKDAQTKEDNVHQIKTTGSQEIKQEDLDEPARSKTIRNRRKQYIREDTDVKQPAQEVRATRSRRVLQIKQEAAEKLKDHGLEESTPETQITSKRVKQQTELDVQAEQSANEIRTPRNARSAKNKQNIDVLKSAENTPAKAGRLLRGKPQIEEKDSKCDEIDQAAQENKITRSRRTQRRKQQIEEDENVQGMVSTRSRKLATNKPQIEEESSTIEKTKNTRNKRGPTNKQQDQGDLKDDDGGHEDIQADELSNNTNQGTNTRSRRQIKDGIKKEDEDREVAKKVKATRSRRQQKTETTSEAAGNETHANEPEIKDIKNEEMSESEDEDREVAKKVKVTRSRRRQKTETTSEAAENETHANEPEIKDIKNEEMSESNDITKNEKGNRKTESKTTRSRKQLKKNEDLEIEVKDELQNEAERKSPRVLRTRKRKVDSSPDQVLVNKTKKRVQFDAIDSPRRSNRTPRKLLRIADEEFEFDVDKISVGHSKKTTRKRNEKAVDEGLEDVAAPTEPRKSRRTRK